MAVIFHTRSLFCLFNPVALIFCVPIFLLILLNILVQINAPETLCQCWYIVCSVLDGLALMSALCACCFARLHPSANCLGPIVSDSGGIFFNVPGRLVGWAFRLESKSGLTQRYLSCYGSHFLSCQYFPASVAPLSPCEALSARWGAATPGHRLHMGAFRSAPHLAFLLPPVLLITP